MANEQKEWYNLSNKVMTPKEKKETAKEIAEMIEPFIEKAVKKHVNGKIDDLHKKFDDHMVLLTFMEKAFGWAASTNNVLTWLAKTATRLTIIVVAFWAFWAFVVKNIVDTMQ